MKLFRLFAMQLLLAGPEAEPDRLQSVKLQLRTPVG